MSHDRSQQQDFHLTHQIMADMLGVRRSAITLAAGQLKKDGVIHNITAYKLSPECYSHCYRDSHHKLAKSQF